MSVDLDSTSTRYSEIYDEGNKEKKYKKKELESNLCPFKLLWSFGINVKVPLINLTTKNRRIIAYACSHTTIIYNYDTKQTLNLQGHKNMVSTLSTSADGKWLLSADLGNDCVAVVWDTENGIPISTLFNPHGDKSMISAKISPNAKYIVTIGNEIPQKVQFWLWTYGRDQPDGSAELSDVDLDQVKSVEFNEDLSEEFVTTSEYHVAFFKWDENELKHYVPQILGNPRRYGIFNCSCFVPRTQRVLTATSNGHVLVWDIPYESKKKSRNKNKSKKSQVTSEVKIRKHTRSAVLSKSDITVMLHHNGLIVTGSITGRIDFFDIDLKILYWFQHDHLDSIQSISFDLSSMLLGPVLADSESEPEPDEEDETEHEERYSRSKSRKASKNFCTQRVEFIQRIESMKHCDEVLSTLTVNIEPTFRNYNKNQQGLSKPAHMPRDATIDYAPFYIENFFVSCKSGTVALIEVPTLKCQLIFKDFSGVITSLDTHPRSNYIAVGNANGYVSLYDYETRKTVVSRKLQQYVDFNSLLEKQVRTGDIIYVTSPETHEKLVAITILKYSSRGDLIACGVENGTLWMLHPITLEPIDEHPYKHSRESITKIVFTECGEYMAYADNTMVVAVFKRNENSDSDHTWDFLGKYRSHYAPITDLIFGPATSDSVVYRLFSVGEDRYLIEYDLKDSGPYPFPGLKILHSLKVETEGIPLALAWYPQFGIEEFLIICNSEYKYRLLNDLTRKIRGTFLGPLYGAPVRKVQVLTDEGHKSGKYMVFATDKEIGIQILPLDGNPYKSLGMIGHPRKITNMAVCYDGKYLFTSGSKDPCVLMWKIKCRSVDVLALLGGRGLTPYYCLIDGGPKGWLMNEMKDLFYYAQIIHQGENTTFPRVVSETVHTKEIPNLMRAVGYYPSNDEIETMLSEVAYRNYAETGHLLKQITFADFVKLYINHRPAFGISLPHIKKIFQVFSNPTRRSYMESEDPILPRSEFMRLLIGEGPFGFSKESGEPFGEPMTIQEAFTYMKILTGCEDDMDELYNQSAEKTLQTLDLSFLPESISYKDFIADIMGVELPEEMRAEDDDQLNS